MRSGPLAGSAIGLFAVALQCMQPVAAAPASAFGPEVQVGEARGGYVGTMHVAPFHGEVGTPFTVTAEDLPPNEEFQLIWRTVNGAWKVTESEYHGREYVPVAYEMAKVRSDAAGRVQATFETPEDFGFVHDIVLQQGERLLTQAGYSIDMAIDISPRSGPAGTPITVAVKGIGWRNLHSSRDLLYDNNYTGWMSAVTTHGSATFTIPATGHVGDHIIEVLHGQFTFPYRNMQQSPEPDRPRWAIPFTITPGDPVLPPAADQQAQTHVRLPAPRGDLVSTPRFSGVGEPITVGGEGLKPGEDYALNWTRVIGNRMTGLGWEESSTPVAEATADANGNVEFKFETPDDLGGTHGLWIDADGTKQLGTHFIKMTAFPMDVARGPVGTTFTLHLKGVGWTETANIVHLVYDNSFIGYACAFNSQGDVEIFVQATGAPGWHFIDLYPGIYKGMEKDPNNFRIPQLTYADDHPGEDLPGFHFAFEVTSD